MVLFGQSGQRAARKFEPVGNENFARGERVLDKQKGGLIIWHDSQIDTLAKTLNRGMLQIFNLWLIARQYLSSLKRFRQCWGDQKHQRCIAKHRRAPHKFRPA